MKKFFILFFALQGAPLFAQEEFYVELSTDEVDEHYKLVTSKPSEKDAMLQSPWLRYENAEKIAWILRITGTILSVLACRNDDRYAIDRLIKEILPIRVQNNRHNPNEAGLHVERQAYNGLQVDRTNFFYRKLVCTLSVQIILSGQFYLWKKIDKKLWELTKREWECKEKAFGSSGAIERYGHVFSLIVFPLLVSAGSVLALELIVDKLFSGLQIRRFDEHMYDEIMTPVVIAGFFEYLCYVIQLMQSSNADQKKRAYMKLKNKKI